MLADPAIVPFAALVSRTNLEQWLSEITQRLHQLESEPERRQVFAYVQLLASFKVLNLSKG